MPCPANARIHGLGADKHPVSQLAEPFCALRPLGARVRGQDNGRAAWELLFLLWLGRNPLKSPESHEEIQENPSPFSSKKSKKIQARFLGFAWSDLGSAWAYLACPGGGSSTPAGAPSASPSSNRPRRARVAARPSPRALARGWKRHRPRL